MCSVIASCLLGSVAIFSLFYQCQAYLSSREIKPLFVIAGLDPAIQEPELALDFRLGGCVAMLFCHYETPLRRRGNLMYGVLQIASVVALSCNDITTCPEMPYT